jgi:hypothetical protein
LIYEWADSAMQRGKRGKSDELLVRWAASTDTAEARMFRQ